LDWLTIIENICYLFALVGAKVGPFTDVALSPDLETNGDKDLQGDE